MAAAVFLSVFGFDWPFDLLPERVYAFWFRLGLGDGGDHAALSLGIKML